MLRCVCAVYATDGRQKINDNNGITRTYTADFAESYTLVHSVAAAAAAIVAVVDVVVVVFFSSHFFRPSLIPPCPLLHSALLCFAVSTANAHKTKMNRFRQAFRAMNIIKDLRGCKETNHLNCSSQNLCFHEWISFQEYERRKRIPKLESGTYIAIWSTKTTWNMYKQRLERRSIAEKKYAFVDIPS